MYHPEVTLLGLLQLVNPFLVLGIPYLSNEEITADNHNPFCHSCLLVVQNPRKLSRFLEICLVLMQKEDLMLTKASYSSTTACYEFTSYLRNVQSVGGFTALQTCQSLKMCTKVPTAKIRVKRKGGRGGGKGGKGGKGGRGGKAGRPRGGGRMSSSSGGLKPGSKILLAGAIAAGAGGTMYTQDGTPMVHHEENCVGYCDEDYDDPGESTGITFLRFLPFLTILGIIGCCTCAYCGYQCNRDKPEVVDKESGAEEEKCEFG